MWANVSYPIPTKPTPVVVNMEDLCVKMHAICFCRAVWCLVSKFKCHAQSDATLIRGCWWCHPYLSLCHPKIMKMGGFEATSRLGWVAYPIQPQKRASRWAAPGRRTRAACSAAPPRRNGHRRGRGNTPRRVAWRPPHFNGNFKAYFLGLCKGISP